MVTFNTTLETAFQTILWWNQKAELNSVIIIRDVFGKVSFVMDNQNSIAEENVEILRAELSLKLGNYFSGKIYWKKMAGSKKNEQERLKLIIRMLEEGKREWRNEEGILFYVSERTIAKKAWINNVILQDAVWPYEETIEGRKPKVITFYSFKGGMGRTTALSGVALSLIKRGHNVMMIDTDIEAPGLATLFLDEERVEKGVLDYLLEYPIEERDIAEYVIDITDSSLLDEKDANLYLMPAGKVDSNYLQKLARIDYQDHRENYLRNSLENMLNRIAERYDIEYILIDARAGFHDMGGIAVTQLPHGSVLIGNNTRQSWEGMTQVLRTIAEGRADGLPVMLVDSMCEQRTSGSFLESKREFENKAYSVCLDNFYLSDEPIPGIDAQDVVHAPEYIPFNEALLHGVTLYSMGGTDQDMVVQAYKELLTGKVYKSITDRIESWFGGEEDDG